MSVEVIGETYAVIIAIEDYLENENAPIPSIEFAKNDAQSFKNILLETFEIPSANIHSFVGTEASLDTIEIELPKLISKLTPLDTFFFYYTGHVFSNRDENLFTLFDSNLENLNGTSAYFDELLFEPLTKNPCKKNFMFIDGAATELIKTKKTSSSVTDLSEREFTNYTNQFSSHACFFSTSKGQLSYPSPKLKRGIWNWHVTQALSGEADKALDAENTVTFKTLKKYLSRSVPTYLTKETKVRGTQEPFAISGKGLDLIIAAFGADQFEDSPIELVSLNTEEYELRRTEIELYKNFAGFVKGRNSEPKKHSVSAETWAQTLTEEDIKQEIEDVYKKTKIVLGHKKRECEKDPAGGFLATPSFRYRVSASQDENDFRSVKTIRVLELRLDMGSIPKGINTIFPKMFEDLYIPITGKLNYDELTEAFEELEDNGHGELTDEDGKLIFSPHASKGVSNVTISDKGIVVNFSTQTESIEQMLNSTQEAFAVISAPIQKLLE